MTVKDARAIFDIKKFMKYLSFKICPHEVGLTSFSGNDCIGTWNRDAGEKERDHQCFLCWDNAVYRFKDSPKEN